MAIYHLSAKAIQRSKGHSSVASSAYRAGEKIKDERTGEVHDYRKKNGVIFSKVVTPNNENISRSELWNMAEKAEKRKDSTTAKEHTLALPAELNAEQRQELALSYAEYLVNSQGCAVDVALHEPNQAGDERNFHAHFLITTRKLENGLLTNKIDMELSDTDRKKKGLAGRKEELEKARTTWENLVNKALERANIQEKVSSKSLKAQGIDREPTQHQGKTATEMERKGKNPDRKKIKDTVLSWGQDLINNIKSMITSQEKELFDLNKEIEQEKAALTPIKKERNAASTPPPAPVKSLGTYQEYNKMLDSDNMRHDFQEYKKMEIIYQKCDFLKTKEDVMFFASQHAFGFKKVYNNLISNDNEVIQENIPIYEKKFEEYKAYRLAKKEIIEPIKEVIEEIKPVAEPVIEVKEEIKPVIEQIKEKPKKAIPTPSRPKGLSR